MGKTLTVTPASAHYALAPGVLFRELGTLETLTHPMPGEFSGLVSNGQQNCLLSFSVAAGQISAQDAAKLHPGMKVGLFAEPDAVPLRSENLSKAVGDLRAVYDASHDRLVLTSALPAARAGLQ